jgi:predicted deacylase
MDAGEPSAPSREVSRHWLRAPVAGRAVQLAGLGDAIGAGEPVAELRDAAGATLATLASPAAGWIGIHVTYGQVAAGDPVSVVFVEAPAR